MPRLIPAAGRVDPIHARRPLRDLGASVESTKPPRQSLQQNAIYPEALARIPDSR